MSSLSSTFDRARHRTVLLAASGDHRLLLAPTRWRDRLAMRLHALELDRDLAAGQPAERDRLHALRAGVLVAPAERRHLADCWERLLGRRRSNPGVWDSRIPVQWDRVSEAAEHIDRLVDALRVTGPVPARGVALASVLLTDGAGPLYSARSRTDLTEAVRDATWLLDPAAGVTGD